MDAGTPKLPPRATGAVKNEEETPVLGINTDIYNKTHPDTPEEGYDLVHNPEADGVDLSDLRGTRAPGVAECNGEYSVIF